MVGLARQLDGVGQVDVVRRDGNLGALLIQAERVQRPGAGRPVRRIVEVKRHVGRE
jgi:hypothetical protein